MNLEITGKTIVVTGGAKGIGEAIVRALADEGATAVIVDKDVAAGSDLASELKRAGRLCSFIRADLSDPAQCKTAVDETLERATTIDALVNNAGINDSVGLETGNPERFVESLRKNLFHYYVMAHHALPALKAAKGSIVNIASKVALTGQGGTSGYAAAKGGILALTREWAAELASAGVRVNAVVPAEVMTPLYRDWLASFPQPDAKLKDVVSRIPLGHRMTTTSEIASAVLFLLSARASHITGEHLHVDGGYVHLDRALK